MTSDQSKGNIDRWGDVNRLRQGRPVALGTVTGRAAALLCHRWEGVDACRDRVIGIGGLSRR